MIDEKKAKIGDVFWYVENETVYEPVDEYYGIYIPSGVKSMKVYKLFKEYNFNVIHGVFDKDGSCYNSERLYYTKEEATRAFKKEIKEEWEAYNCDSILSKLLNIKKLKEELWNNE